MAVEKTAHGTTRAGTKKSGRKRLKNIEVRRSANGGFIAKHSYKSEYGGRPKSEEHAFSDYDGLKGHVEKTAREHK